MNIDIMSIVEQYAVIPVAAVCWMVGWLMKHVWEGFPNRFIPVAIVPIGIVSVLWLNAWAVTPETILGGVCSAAAAVWLHQVGKHLGNNDTVDDDLAEEESTEDEEPQTPMM